MFANLENKEGSWINKRKNKCQAQVLDHCEEKAGMCNIRSDYLQHYLLTGVWLPFQVLLSKQSLTCYHIHLGYQCDKPGESGAR